MSSVLTKKGWLVPARPARASPGSNGALEMNLISHPVFSNLLAPPGG
jgi:hypothetical protein